MSIKPDSLITEKDQLISYFKNGCKSSSLKIGTEHEKFLFDIKTKKPVNYRGYKSIQKIFEVLQFNGWIPIFDEKNLIGLKKNKKSITLEPGLQLELSGEPLSNIHDTCKEVNEYYDYQSNSIRDRIELIEYVLEKREAEPEMLKKFQEVLEMNKRTLKSYEKAKDSEKNVRQG